MTPNKLACLISQWFASPAAILGVLVACGGWVLAGWSVDALTLVLSILAITVSQLVLLAQDRDTKALHAKIDGLVKGTPGVDDALVGIEKD